MKKTPGYFWNAGLLTALFYLTSIAPTAHADCEGLLRGLRVESEFSIGDPWKATYFQIASDYLQAKTTLSVHYDHCTSATCKNQLDLITEARWNRQLVRFGVDPATCEDLWNYFILMNGGGTADFLPIEHLSSVQLDLNYPF